jgi:hypothetical protein
LEKRHINDRVEEEMEGYLVHSVEISDLQGKVWIGIILPLMVTYAFQRSCNQFSLLST